MTKRDELGGGWELLKKWGVSNKPVGGGGGLRYRGVEGIKVACLMAVFRTTQMRLIYGHFL